MKTPPQQPSGPQLVARATKNRTREREKGRLVIDVLKRQIVDSWDRAPNRPSTDELARRYGLGRAEVVDILIEDLRVSVQAQFGRRIA